MKRIAEPAISRQIIFINLAANNVWQGVF
jgi:hypothetical protein